MRYFFGMPKAWHWERVSKLWVTPIAPTPVPGVTPSAATAPAPLSSPTKLGKGEHPHILDDINDYMNSHMSFLNNSKVFAGCVMILLNVGSKFIQIQFSKSMEEYMKMTVTKEILVFAMAWIGTRDVFSALCLTGAFIILSEYLFNEDHDYCIIPHHHRVLPKFRNDQPNDLVTEDDISTLMSTLEKLKKEKYKEKIERNRDKVNENSSSEDGPIPAIFANASESFVGGSAMGYRGLFGPSLLGMRGGDGSSSLA